MREKREKNTRGPIVLPIVLVAFGVILLLNNFLLLTDFNLSVLWPLLLVAAGVQILLHGDLVPSSASRSFAITRGSVRSAVMEISAGEIDVYIVGLEREGRLIAGQYAAESRPDLRVNDEDAHASLRLDRAATPWFSFADWEIGLADDLPWQLFLSTSLGQVELDLRDVVLNDATIATGLGDIRLTCPKEAMGTVRLQSAVGNIHVITPEGYAARITVQPGALFGVHADLNRFAEIAPGVFQIRDAVAGVPIVNIHITGTFGDAYLA